MTTVEAGQCRLNRESLETSGSQSLAGGAVHASFPAISPALDVRKRQPFLDGNNRASYDSYYGIGCGHMTTCIAIHLFPIESENLTRSISHLDLVGFLRARHEVGQARYSLMRASALVCGVDWRPSP